MTSKSVGLVLATAMLFAAAPSAFADAPCTTGVGSPTIVDVTQHITNDVDSGFHGNWALDNYDRRLRVWLDTDGTTYCAQADYNGTFHAPAGVLSPGQTGGSLITGDIDGTMVGGYTKAITGGTPTTSPITIPTSLDYGGTLANISTWTSALVPSAYNFNTSQNWLDAVFNAGYTSDFINSGNGWSWTYISNGTGSLPGWINAGTGSVGDIAPFVDTNTGTGYFSLQTAINSAIDGDTIAFATDATTTTQINVTKAVTIDGGGHTLHATGTNGGNSNNSAIGITASGVTIKNLIEDGTGSTGLHGINVYQSNNVTLDNVTVSHNGHAGMVVNGSDVTATNFNANNDVWGSVNVDPGSGVTVPSVFTLNGGTLGDTTQIWSDGGHVSSSATVTVNASGYTMYHAAGTTAFYVWANHAPKGAVIGSTLYSTIAAAIAAANGGDTVQVGPGTYTETVNITKPLMLKGAQAGVAGNAHSGSESSVTALNITSNDVTVDGFAFTNAGVQANVSSTTAIMSGITLKNNVFSGYSNVGIPTYNAGNIVIENNAFKNVSGLGEAMQIKADTLPGCTGSQVLNNVFTDATSNGGADVNFSCTGSDSQNVTVSGNTSAGITGGSSFVAFSGVDGGITVSNNTATTDGSSIFFFGNVTGSASITGNTVKNSGGSGVSIHGNHEFTSDGPDTGTFTITGNTLTGNANGVAVSSAALGMGASILIHNNSISGNTSKNINSATSTAIDAANNWWGSASSTVFASSIVGNVATSPWYLNPDRTVLSNAVASNGTVDSSSGDFTVLGSSGTATLPDGVTGLTLGDDGVLDLSGATTTGSGAPVTIGGATVTLAQAVTLQSGVDTEPIVLANTNLSGVTASIPDGTTIQGPTEWDGTIAAPTAIAMTGTVPAGFSAGGTAITVGSSAGTLVFDNPVTLTLAGVTGAVGFKPAGSDTWTQITTACGGDYASPTAPTAPGECFISNGTDTKIVTYHFTTYGGMTIAAPVISPNGAVSRGAIEVTLDDISGTTVHYTTDGTDPICSSTQYTGPLSLSVAFLKAIRCDSLGNQSAISSATFAQSGGGGGGGGGSIAATPATPATPTVSPAAPATPATPAQGQVLGAAGYKFTLALATGSKNADVTALQQYLTTNGYYSGPVTGYFGPLTRAAVVAFQKARSIVQTGTVGPLTRAALNENVAETTGSSGTAAAAGAKLTVAQVNAILNVLQSFGADADVIAKVKAALGQ